MLHGSKAFSGDKRSPVHGLVMTKSLPLLVIRPHSYLGTDPFHAATYYTGDHAIRTQDYILSWSLVWYSEIKQTLGFSVPKYGLGYAV